MKLRVTTFVSTILLLGASSVAIAQDAPTGEDAATVLKGRPYSPNADRGFPDQVLFGDTHVHSALSADAGGGGTSLMPRDMYRFARGEQVNSNTGQPVKLSRPFDFYMLTEHTDGMGVITDIMKGAPNIMADAQGKAFHEAFAKGGEDAKQASIDLIAQFSQGTLSEALLYQPGSAGYDNTWRDLVHAAEEFNDPHRFTTMIAYEWTSLTEGNNLHRNVIFRDGPERALQVVPFLMAPPAGSPNPRDLWKWMQNYEDTTGGDVLAIPHNPNLSNGIMFALNDTFRDGEAFDPEYLKTRSTWERLVEINQTKGTSEAHPMLSPADDFADYELWDWSNLDLSAPKTPEMLATEYVRETLKNGLAMGAENGTNPFKLGFVGGSDIHTGLTTQDDNNFFGAFAWMEPNPKRAASEAKANTELDIGYKGWQYATPGPTAVWATSNTRAAIFDAMERREVYSTTGPRITLRFFGSYDFSAEDIKTRDLARVGYSKGIPMGGDLVASDGASPNFLVYAMRDPVGANLDRIQIVKGWVDQQGETQEKVYDVVWSDARQQGDDGKLAPVGNTVDLAGPTWTNDIGAAELGTVWTDPDFDAAQHAFYYARVIEIPTPRWPAYDAVRFGVEMPAEVKLITQERAYSSPIWHTPDE
ncbi:DUF3604 domain-containing protein [Shimia thalassica]|uniref:DUF3604 domain-containing protein n=1 Tax=Shimia thalassica TaxID=1715693 RepID=UPI0027363E6B|nr:DUF3604 domain-containing protein [Shimia thalassica]MDP2580758.1 DUF3604 domain-containing protein [Shimia thalassica]